MRAALALTLTVGAAALLVRFYAPARVCAWYAVGRAGICSLGESLDALRVHRLQAAAIERLKQSSRMLERDAAGLELWETPKGRFWMPAGGGHVLQYDLAEQERGIYAHGGHGVRTGDIVLDCGAHVGLYTREALAAGARMVVAIEPAPENLECLRRNLAPEIAAGRVVVYAKGVWDRDESLPLYTDPRNSAAGSFARVPDQAGPIRVLPLTTIDRLTAELALARVDFIKMDIEGAEQKALMGAAATLARYRPRLAVCVYHLADDPVRVPFLVRQMAPGYRMAAQCRPLPGRVQAEVVHFH
jgi:FkbM family methyltransferase